MTLIRSRRTPYLSVNPDTKAVHWTGSLYQGPVKMDENGVYTLVGTQYTEQEILEAFFPEIAAAPSPEVIKAQGRALLARLRRK